MDGASASVFRVACRVKDRMKRQRSTATIISESVVTCVMRKSLFCITDGERADQHSRRSATCFCLELSSRSLLPTPTAIMGPPLMPTQAGFALIASRPAVQIEMFVDLVCPFSMKMYNTVYNDVLPKLAGKTDLNIVVNQVPQPWHPQGTYVHEAAFAVKAAAPDAYPAYLSAVYKAFESGKFRDDDTIDKSRKQIYAELLDQRFG